MSGVDRQPRPASHPIPMAESTPTPALPSLPLSRWPCPTGRGGLDHAAQESLLRALSAPSSDPDAAAGKQALLPDCGGDGGSSSAGTRRGDSRLAPQAFDGLALWPIPAVAGPFHCGPCTPTIMNRIRPAVPAELQAFHAAGPRLPAAAAGLNRTPAVPLVSFAAGGFPRASHPAMMQYLPPPPPPPPLPPPPPFPSLSPILADYLAGLLRDAPGASSASRRPSQPP